MGAAPGPPPPQARSCPEAVAAAKPKKRSPPRCRSPLRHPNRFPTPAPAAKPAPAGEKEAAPAEEVAEGQTLEGTVVQVSDPAGSYALAIKGGELVSVHALELPPPGTKLSAPVRRLANGTFAEDGKPSREKQLSKVASFRGGVTYVDAEPAAPAYTVSTRGASLLVHTKPDPSGAAPELPAIGAYVTVTAQIGDELSQRKLELEPGPPSTYLDLAGIFREVSPETGQLLLSADDAGESEADLTLSLPKEIDASKLKAGDSYLATAELGEDGSLALKGIAGDERSKGADDAGSAQGDLKRQTGS